MKFISTKYGFGIAILIIIFCLNNFVRAETFILTNGKVIEGRIVGIRGDTYNIETAEGLFATYSRDDVVSIEYRRGMISVNQSFIGAVTEFDLGKEMLADTNWVKDIVKIYYNKPGTRDLYSINSDGSNNKKVVEDLGTRTFGWSPAGDKIFVVTKNGFFVMDSKGENRERIYDILTSDDSNPLLKYYVSMPIISGPKQIQWSPDGNFLLFGIIDEDTNKDGKVEVIGNIDGTSYYLIDLATKEKIKFLQTQSIMQENYPKDSVHAIFWSNDAKQIYIFNTRFTSANDFTDQVLVYDITSKKTEKIREGNARGHGDNYSYIYIESLKDSLSFTRKNFQTNNVTTTLNEENGIRIVGALGGGNILLQRKLEKDSSGYTNYSLGTAVWRKDVQSNIFPTCFFWLPGKRYIVFKYGTDICIMDPREMKAGKLIPGEDFGWFEKNSSYETWKERWWLGG